MTMDFVQFLRDAEQRTREMAWGLNPDADAGDKTRGALMLRADEWKECADRMQHLQDWQKGAKLAADGILAPITAEIGWLLEESPYYPIKISAAEHEITIPAEKFMALYHATEVDEQR
jgi:hypothetical protein